MKIVLVIAGNYNEGRHYLEGLAGLARTVKKQGRPYPTWVDGTEYRLIDDPIYMKGYRGVEVRFIGTYYKRPNIREFEAEARNASCP